MNNNEEFFILDIGTRLVRGAVCERQAPGSDTAGPTLRIIDSEILEHETRAMRSGQIHDIEKVAAIVKRIKFHLENREHGQKRTLAKVSVAVAGRNLITSNGTARQERPPHKLITPEEVNNLRFEAVRSALEKFDTETEYTSAGYSVLDEKLDGESIKSLTDHRGSSIETSIMVTLLPRQVLEAMFAVMEKAGLEIEYLTLEPIAALECSVAENLHSLNIILIDIGAGTSDIAIVHQGKISAYGMVPVAGDMITEAICSEYLVDFNEGERIKRTEKDCINIRYKDIFNREDEKPLAEIFNKIRPAVINLSQRINEDVRKYAKAASDFAVVLVGGGSQTPFIEEELSKALGLPLSRIGSRPAYLNKKAVDTTGKFSGVNATVTVGIGLLRIKQQGLSLIHLTLNEERVTVVTSEKKPDILSALLSRGIPMKKIYGLPGAAKTITINGKMFTIKGELPTPAVLKLNGTEASLDIQVKDGDKIIFYPAKDGKEKAKKISEVIEDSWKNEKKIVFNGREICVPYKVIVNGKETGPEIEVEDRAAVELKEAETVCDLLTGLGFDLRSVEKNTILLDIDGEDREFDKASCALKVNGEERQLAEEIKLHGCNEIDFYKNELSWKVKDVVSGIPPSGRDLNVVINGERYSFPGAKGRLLLNGKNAAMETEIKSGDIIRNCCGKDAEAILVDVFRYISVNPREQLGKRMRILINEQEANFSSPLFNDAKVKVLFE
ncbi:MAG: rod shape-determining protein [Elusimicrobia bacterium]|nr:rod shape-determining protein [Candidatus Liberimonas magnetica]